MLKVLRRKGVMKIFLWIIAVVIIVVFGLAGESYLLRDGGRPGYAGKVFGKKISLKEYDKQLRRVQLNEALSAEDRPARRDPLELDEDTWNRIILLREAARRRIRVFDDDIVAAIKRQPIFQRDGRFDRFLYNDIIRYGLKVSQREFEEGMRDDLKIAALFEEETAGIDVTGDEALSLYRYQNEKIQVSYAFFPAEDFVNEIAVDETAAKQYFMNNRDQFIRPATVNVEYVVIRDAPADGEPDEDGAADDNPPDDGEKSEDAFSRALDVYADLQSHGDFVRAAADHGVERRESGFFSVDSPRLEPGWTFPVVREILELETGEISQPLETEEGFQIARVIDRRPSAIPSYQDAAEEIRQAWALHEAKDRARNAAIEARTQLLERIQAKKIPDFPDIARDLGLQVDQTPVFARGQYLPGIGLNRAFQQAAFSLTVDDPLSDVVETERGYAILYLDDVFPVKVADFEERKDEIMLNMTVAKKTQAFNEFLAVLRLQADLENNIPELYGR